MQQVESLKVDQQKLMVELESAFRDTGEKRRSISHLEQQLAVQASLFDSKISTMQAGFDFGHFQM